MEPIQIAMGSVQKTGNQLNIGLSLLLVLRGTVLMKSPDQTRTLEANQLSVLNHNDFFAIESAGPNVILWLNMGRNWLETLCPEALSGRFLCCCALSNPATEPLYESLRHGVTRVALLHYRRDPGDPLLLQAELLRLLQVLTIHFRTGERAPVRDSASPRLQPILDHICQNCRDAVTLKRVAQLFFLSPAHLARLFRKELGMTFMEYLTALRLENARQELLYTDESMTRVAMNCGFSSVRAMNQYFQHTFGCTPAQYRKKMAAEPRKTGVFWLEDSPDGSLKTLVRFVDTYENRLGETARRQVMDLSVSGRPMTRPDRLLNVGDLSQLLREDLLLQLREAHGAIGFQYIYFSGLFREQLGDTDLFQRFDCLDLLESLLRLGLTPFVRIDTEREEAHIAPVLTMLLARLGQEEMCRWKFELAGSFDETGNPVRRSVQTLKTMLPKAHIGLFVDMDEPPRWADGPQGRNLLPLVTDFVTTSSDPNGRVPAGDTLSFELFQRRYHQNHLGRLRGWLAERGRSAPVYLTSWNTLTGRSVVEAGEFHRSALIVDTLLALRDEVAGYAVRLNLQEQTDQRLSYPLSLYLLRNVKRTSFSVLRGLASVGSQILFEEPGTIVSRIRPGRYTILISNPCYIDPFLSLSNLRQDDYCQTWRLILRGLEPGHYRIKRLYIDKENGGLYRSWMKIDMTAHMDRDVMEYLSHAGNPTVSLENRAVTDELELVQKLPLNAAAFWVIRQVESACPPRAPDWRTL